MNVKVRKIILIATAMFFGQTINVNAQKEYKRKILSIPTRWTNKFTTFDVLSEYPRPQMARTKWRNLNGIWEYTVTKTLKKPEKYDGQIIVPFPIESSLSGVKKAFQYDQLLWYRRKITNLSLKPGERTLLNFGAVDYQATVYLNDKEIGNHTGGYTSFSFDITDALVPGDNELTVKVYDPSDKGINPHGKQVLNPEGIMYTPSSGIWQTVWLETVPAAYISDLTITPNLDKSIINVIVKSSSNAEVKLAADGKIIIGRSNVNIEIPINSPKLWSPDSPFLYDLKVTLGKDEVTSYFGMRKIEIKKDYMGFERIFLNNKYTYNLGTLDQGFWPDGLYTAPTDEALAFDIKASKAMGFNTIRKHIKVEPARWYYHADRLGMLVWQDLVNPGSDTPLGRAEFEKESKEIIEQLHNYPSITTWVLFNEKWGQFDQQRLTNWIKKADPSRLVNGHSGEMLYVNDQLRSASPNAWVDADITDVHAYPMPGHLKFQKGKAAVIGEFGGIGVPIENHLWDDLVAGWGYDGVVTPQVLQKQYTQMVDSLKVLEKQGLTASIYTQPFDVESEQNGLMTYDREIIKLSIDTLRAIHQRLWPTTSNYKKATIGFSAKLPDNNINNLTDRIVAYQAGNREPKFLRKLAIMAFNVKNEEVAIAAAQNYINQLKSLSNDSDIKFVQRFTSSIREAGFAMLKNELKQQPENKSLGQAVQNIVFREEVKPLLTEKPDWKAIDQVIQLYQGTDGELIIGLTVIHYLNAVGLNEENATKNVTEAATLYDNRFNSGAYNTWAWVLFEKSIDRLELEKALDWSKKSIELEPGIAAYLDTYANLLHKLGRNKEAIEWSARAVGAAPDDQEIKNNYEKIKAGVKTWRN